MLALRLFRPEPFWFSAGNDRRAWLDIKPIGSELSIHDAGLEREYSLDTREVERFSKFAKRLAPFHFNRHLYRILRYHPAAVEWTKIFGSTVLPEIDAAATILPEKDPSGTQFLTAFAHIIVAVEFFERAGAEARRAEELRLLFLMIAAEALVGDDRPGEKARDKIARRMAVLREQTTRKEPSVELVQRLYSGRNALVHGTTTHRQLRHKSTGTIYNYGFLQLPARDVDEFSDLIRRCLLHALSLMGRRGWSNGPPKMATIKRLEQAVRDRREAGRIRNEVAEFCEFNGEA